MNTNTDRNKTDQPQSTDYSQLEDKELFRAMAKLFIRYKEKFGEEPLFTPLEWTAEPLHMLARRIEQAVVDGKPIKQEQHIIEL